VAKRKRPAFYYFGNWALVRIFRLLMRVDIRGLENTPRAGPLVVAISHSTFLDPLLAVAYTPRDVTPMAKIEAFHLPVIGLILRWYGAFPIRRGEVDLTAFKTALQVLRDGDAMVIAPEGHRSESGALQRGREGAIILSLRTGAPILPVAVWGGKPFWHNLPRLRRTRMWYYVGEPVIPVFTTDKPKREQIAAMSDELMARIASMMPPEVRGYYADPTMVKTHYLQPYRPSEAAAIAAPKEKEAAID
jgi:1-acyl-sn-glycerol-3-phosphate acyltransferase